MTTEDKVAAMLSHNTDPDVVEICNGFQMLLEQNRAMAGDLQHYRTTGTPSVCGLLRQALNLLEGKDGREKASDQQDDNGPYRDRGRLVPD